MLETFDTISIIIGLFIGIITTFLLIRYLPRLFKSTQSTKKTEKLHKRDINKDQLLRKFVLRKLQKHHLAPELCPLSDIYVQQFLYSHPLHANFDGLKEEEPLFFREALSMADVPELAIEFPIPKITLAQALSNGKNISIAGGIGTGKTTCIANLAIEIIEKRCETSSLNDHLPVMIHVIDILILSEASLLDIISNSLFDEGLELSPPEINKILNDYLVRSKWLLMIDGLDELRHADFDSAVSLINRIHNEYPDLLMVTTCGPFYAGKLASAGFAILPIRPPGRDDQETLFALWENIFSKIPKSDEKTGFIKPTNAIIKRWYNQEILPPSYADLSLAIISYFYQDQVPDNQFFIPFLNRNSDNLGDLNSFTQIAESLSNSQFFSIKRQDLIKKVVSKNTINDNFSQDFVTHLLENNILSSSSERLRFTHPAILCQLLALSDNYHPSDDINTLLHSPIDNLASLYSVQDRSYLRTWLENLKIADVRQIAITLNHLFFFNSSTPDISSTYPKLAQFIISPQLPLSTKIKIASTIYYTNQSVFLQLLTKLYKLTDSDSRRLSAFFFGLLQESQNSKVLTETLHNDQASVAIFGFLALLNSTSSSSANKIYNNFLEIPEKYGRLAAELCSQYPNMGYQVLRDLSKAENTVLRRNAVYGLRLIHEDWASNLLEEINRNDKAWIIRDAAANALLNKHKPDIYAPGRLQPASENPVLLTASSRLSSGISVGSLPFDLLNEIIENGTLNERIVAFRYLIESPNKNSIQKIIKLVSFDNPLREIAARFLFEMYLRT